MRPRKKELKLKNKKRKHNQAKPNTKNTEREPGVPEMSLGLSFGHSGVPVMRQQSPNLSAQVPETISHPKSTTLSLPEPPSVLLLILQVPSDCTEQLWDSPATLPIPNLEAIMSKGDLLKGATF